MKIQVGLLDESAIIQKMLSHCLHHFVVDIHTFKNWDHCLLHTNNKDLNILFVDWDMSHGEKRLIELAGEQLSSVPAVLMRRQDASAELSKIDPALVPHQITKPLNPKQVRDTFSKLVPQITESPIHSFLKFPKSPSNLQETSPTPTTQPLSTPSHKTANKTAQTIPFNLQEKNSLQPSSSPLNKDTSKEKLSFSEEAQTNPAQTNPTQSFLNQNPVNQETISIKPSLSKSKKIDKSQIVLNEDTKNDLAPMAIKSSETKKTAPPTSPKLTEEQILEVLKKYKDSLEFTKLMEKVLSDHAKEAVQSLLEPDQAKNTLKESIQNFQDGAKFKKQVDEEISSQITAYLKEELPLKIKSILQEEIKKILSE